MARIRRPTRTSLRWSLMVVVAVQGAPLVSFLASWLQPWRQRGRLLSQRGRWWWIWGLYENNGRYSGSVSLSVCSRGWCQVPWWHYGGLGLVVLVGTAIVVPRRQSV
ncbi:hypothetical protein BJV78DRAFT_1224302 [Lactifluus subvellereus]|nr:hypothetical protein BJV78DRAFT_1224302 [Lactifluus subvellereus]